MLFLFFILLVIKQFPAAFPLSQICQTVNLKIYSIEFILTVGEEKDI